MFVGAKFVKVSLPEVYRKWFRIIVKSIVVKTRQFLGSFGKLPEDASVITAIGNSDNKQGRSTVVADGVSSPLLAVS